MSVIMAGWWLTYNKENITYFPYVWVVIGGTERTVVGRRGQVQDTDIIKEVVVYGAGGATPMDGAGEVMVSYIVYTSTCGKHGLVGMSGGLSYLRTE